MKYLLILLFILTLSAQKNNQIKNSINKLKDSEFDRTKSIGFGFGLGFGSKQGKLENLLANHFALTVEFEWHVNDLILGIDATNFYQSILTNYPNNVYNLNKKDDNLVAIAYLTIGYDYSINNFISILPELGYGTAVFN